MAGTSVAVVTPRTVTRSCLAFLGYGGRLDDFELQRYRLLATRLDTRFVVLESPGSGSPAFRTARADRHALRRGDFGSLSVRARSVAEQVLAYDEVAEWHVLGYSMGASIAAAVSEVASRVLVEPVAVTSWRVHRLAWAMRAEVPMLSRHLAETAAVPGAAGPARRASGLSGRRDQICMPVALCRSRIAVPAPTGRADAARWMLVRADHSRVVPALATDQLADAATSAGHRVTTVTVPGGHGFWHSWPRVLDLGRELATFWEQA